MNIAKKALLTVATLANMVVAGQAASTVASTKEPIKNTLNVVDNLPEDFLKANFLINGTSASKLELTDKGDNVYTLTYDYTFPGVKDFSKASTLSLSTSVTLVYENNNVYVSYGETTYPKGVEVSDDGKEIVVDDVVYDVACITDVNLKTLDLRILVNAEKTEKRVLDKIAAITSESAIAIKEVASLENLQLTSLEQISLGEEIYKTKEGGYYRTIFLQEGNRYLPIKNLYFDTKGEVDPDKTLKQEQSLTVMGEKVVVNASLKKEELTVKSIENIDQVEARVQAHQAKLIEMINKARIGSPEVFVGANKAQQERAWSDGEEVFTFNTDILQIRLVNDTYLFQWGNDESQVIRFGVTFNEKDPSKDVLFLKDVTGTKVTSYDIKVGEDFYTIKIETEQLIIDKITNSKDILTDEFPRVEGDEQVTALFSAESELKIYVGKDVVEYFTPDGKKITSFPSTLTDKGLWELGDINTTVDPKNLFSLEMLEGTDVDLASMNLTQQDLQKIFEAGLKSEKVDLTRKGVVALYNGETQSYDYYTIDQKRAGDAYILVKDADLYEDVQAIVEGIKERLAIVKQLQESQLRWKNGENEQRFEGFVGGGWGLEKKPLSVAEIISFLDESSDVVNQPVVWGEGSTTVIPYHIHNGKVKLHTSFLQSKIKSPISGQTYTVRLESDGTIKLIFDPIEKRK